MDSQSIAPAQVRKLLEQRLRTDEDLDALCIDYFPEVHRRFSGGMSRPQKVNLLLTMVQDLGTIVASLDERHPASPPNSATAHRIGRRWPRLALMVALAAALVLLAGVLWSQHESAGGGGQVKADSAPRPSPTGVARQPAPAAPAAGINSDNEIRNSPGGIIRNKLVAPVLPARANSGNRLQDSENGIIVNEVQVGR